MSEVLTISCDESGHTGPDLLDADQRYFAFGSVAIADDEAFEIIQRARREHPVQMPELKAARLMRTGRGRALIASVVKAAEGRFAVNIHEKLLALCGWIFEYVYEPVYKDNPKILYQKNLHRFVAMYSWLWFQKAGSEAEEAIRQFQAYMRSLDETKAPLLFDRIQKPLSEYEREHPFEMVLRFAHGYRALIIADNAKIVDASSDRGRWVLDLSTSALWSHLNHWGKKKKPLKVNCDASKPLEDFHDKFKGDESDPGIIRARELYGPDSLGWKLAETISFVDSRNYPAVQLADIVASAAVSFMAHGIPEDMQETASLIEQSFLRDSIFPDMDVVNLKNRSAAVNWLILYDLAERAERGANPYANLAEMYREAEISWARGDFQQLLKNQL